MPHFTPLNRTEYLQERSRITWSSLLKHELLLS